MELVPNVHAHYLGQCLARVRKLVFTNMRIYKYVRNLDRTESHNDGILYFFDNASQAITGLKGYLKGIAKLR